MFRGFTTTLFLPVCGGCQIFLHFSLSFLFEFWAYVRISKKKLNKRKRRQGERWKGRIQFSENTLFTSLALSISIHRWSHDTQNVSAFRKQINRKWIFDSAIETYAMSTICAASKIDGTQRLDNFFSSAFAFRLRWFVAIIPAVYFEAAVSMAHIY